MVLATWEAAYRIVEWNDYSFPAPSHVVDAMLDLLNVRTAFGDHLHHGWPRPVGEHLIVDGGVIRSRLVFANLTSGLRLGCGFAISIILGIALGGVMWRFVPVNEFFGPLALGLQTLPSVCWVPIAIVAFSYSEAGILFVMVMGSMFAVAISVRDGLRTIPPLYERAGLMLGASGWRLYRFILLPAALPAMSSGLRQGFSFAWRSLMGAELVFGAALYPKGLGSMLEDARNIYGTPYVIAVMIVMVIFGMVADRLIFAPLEKRISRRFGLSGAK